MAPQGRLNQIVDESLEFAAPTLFWRFLDRMDLVLLMIAGVFQWVAGTARCLAPARVSASTGGAEAMRSVDGVMPFELGRGWLRLVSLECWHTGPPHSGWSVRNELRLAWHRHVRRSDQTE